MLLRNKIDKTSSKINLCDLFTISKTKGSKRLICQLAGSSKGTSRLKMTSILLAYATFIAFSCVAQAISSSWRPILPAHNVGASILHQDTSIFENTQTLYDVDSSHLLLPHDQEKCSLYKVAMTQQLYFEVSRLALPWIPISYIFI